MNKNVRKLTVCAVFAAISIVLMILNLSLPFLPFYLSFDIGDLPALIGAFSLGPVWGVLICLIKNLIHIFMSNTGGVGEIANFLNGAFFVFTAGTIYKHHKNKKGAMTGVFAGTFSMCILGFIANLFLIYPLYDLFVMPYENIIAANQLILPWADTIPKGLLVFNLPLTFARGVIISIITMLVYKRLSPIIKGK